MVPTKVETRTRFDNFGMAHFFRMLAKVPKHKNIYRITSLCFDGSGGKRW